MIRCHAGWILDRIDTGANNHANTVKATILGLSQMRSPKEVLARRRQFSAEATIGR